MRGATREGKNAYHVIRILIAADANAVILQKS
jgi:hypothetical protein